MNRKVFILFFLCLNFMVLEGCFVKKKAIEFPITLTKSGCKGRCPVYTIDLKADGHILFNGKQHTAREGIEQIRLNKEERQLLYGLYLNIDFGKSLPSYHKSMYDFPETVLSDRVHTVSYRRRNGPPKPLLEFVDALENILKKHQLL